MMHPTFSARTFAPCVLALFLGCNTDAVPITLPPPVVPPCSTTRCVPQELNVYTVLSIATHDGSGQSVHPDVLADRRSSALLWMVVTPYPGGDAMFENPSLYASADGIAWGVPSGLANPVEHPQAGECFSDPDLTLNAAGTGLRMYFRAVRGTSNDIRVTESTDGLYWRTPASVLSSPDHALISPAVVHGGSGRPWQMWTVNAGSEGCGAISTRVEHRTSSDGLQWNAPELAGLTQPGRNIWHLDVQWVEARHEYWAVYNTYDIQKNCATDAIYLARSSDGVHWTSYPSPVTRRGVIAELSDLVYRSTFLVDATGQSVTFWISGASYRTKQYVWRTAAVRFDVAALLTRLARPEDPMPAIVHRSDLPPPEPYDVGH